MAPELPASPPLWLRDRLDHLARGACPIHAVHMGRVNPRPDEGEDAGHLVSCDLKDCPIMGRSHHVGGAVTLLPQHRRLLVARSTGLADPHARWLMRIMLDPTIPAIAARLAFLIAHRVDPAIGWAVPPPDALVIETGATPGMVLHALAMLRRRGLLDIGRSSAGDERFRPRTPG